MAVIGTFTAGAILSAAELNQFNNVVILAGSNAQAIANATLTAVTFGAGTETLDVSGWHSTTTNTSRITPTIAGYYLATARVGYNRTGAAARFVCYIGKNGGFGEAESSGSGTDYPNMTCSAMFYMNGTTDYMECLAYQTSGVTVNLVSQNFSTMLLRKA